MLLSVNDVCLILNTGSGYLGIQGSAFFSLYYAVFGVGMLGVALAVSN